MEKIDNTWQCGKFKFRHETLTLYVNGPNLPFKDRLSYQIKK